MSVGLGDEGWRASGLGMGRWLDGGISPSDGECGLKVHSIERQVLSSSDSTPFGVFSFHLASEYVLY